MRLSSRSRVTPRVCGTLVPAPKWPNCLVSEGAWGRISGLRARVTTLTLVPRALAWFFPLPVSAPQHRGRQQMHLVVHDQTPVMVVEQGEVWEVGAARWPVRQHLVGRDRDRPHLLPFAAVLADRLGWHTGFVEDLVD